MKRTYLLIPIVCLITMIFSFPALAYKIDITGGYGRDYHDFYLSWSPDSNSYSQGFWFGDLNYDGLNFITVMPDPGDPVHGQVQVKISYGAFFYESVYASWGNENEWNFMWPPAYDVHYGSFVPYDMIMNVTIGELTYVPMGSVDAGGINFTSYPPLFDPSIYTQIILGVEVSFGFSAQVIGPVPEPTTILLLGLGLVGLAGVRRKMQ